MSGPPLIIAHRGASREAPENTLAAFRAAIDMGADGVEFDVRLARDGVPVVIHDATLKRTGGRMDKVADLTSEQLGSVDAGSWFNHRYPKRGHEAFTAEAVPTLSDTLTLLTASKGLIYVELKSEDLDLNPLVTAVCDVIRDSPLLPRIIVKSFRLAAIPAVCCQLPEVQTAALFAPQIMSYLRRRKYTLALAREFGADQISLHRSLATRRLVQRATYAGVPVTVWTADDPRWVERCRRFGIGAMITNDPRTMLAARDG